MEDNLALVDLQDATRLAHRAPTWHNLWGGEYPITITGFASHMNFLAYYMEITTNMRTFPPISAERRFETGSWLAEALQAPTPRSLGAP